MKRRSDYIERPLCRCGCGHRVKKLHLTWIKGHQNEWPNHSHPSPFKKPRPPCLCGCGQPVLHPRRQWLHGHFGKVHGSELGPKNPKRGADSPSWHGGRRASGQYVGLHASLSDEGSEHREFARRAMGHAVGSNIVFAVRPERGKYVPGNIVVGSSFAYVGMIQRRARAYDATGDASKRWCMICRTWDDEKNLRLRVQGNCTSTYHRACANFYAHLTTSKLWTPPERGAEWYAMALQWKRDNIERRELNKARLRDRPLRGKAGGTRRVRKSDPPKGTLLSMYGGREKY